MITRRSQQGSALVVALFFFSLATITAVAITNKQSLQIRRTANLLEREQALLYVKGLESWSSKILQRDLENNDSDHTNERWFQPIEPIPIDGGMLAGQMYDLQGRFNINNVIKTSDGVDEISQVDLDVFKRLLSILEINPSVADAILDWIDSDVDVRFPDGAEENEYLSLKPAYRNANQPFTSPSELRLVKGIDIDIYEKLQPHITTLPNKTEINVNTATIPVLMSLADGLTKQQAQSLVEGRGKTGYQKRQDFLDQAPIQGLQVAHQLVSVKTNHFLLVADAKIGRGKTRLFSILARDDNASHTIWRSLGESFH